jgi:hypothetical protein
MSRSLERHRRRLAAIAGDGASDAKTFSSLISTLAQAGGEIAAQQEEKKAKAAASKDKDAAVAAAKDARKKADLAKADALAEADPKGPLHQAAIKADTAAKVAEAKAAVYSSGDAGASGGDDVSTDSKGKDKGKKGGHGGGGSGMPTWLWWALGGVGVMGAGFVTYKLVKGKGRR